MKTITIIVVILIIFVSLITNIIVIHSRNETNYRYNKLQKIFFDQKGEIGIINPTFYKYSKVKIDSSLFFDKKIDRLQLVAVFDDKSCPRCIYMEISYLKPLVKKYGNHISIIYQGNNKDFLRRTYDLRTPYKSIPAFIMIFSQKHIISKPYSILVDEDRNVLFLHRSEKSIDIKSKVFYSYIDYLFGLIFQKHTLK